MDKNKRIFTKINFEKKTWLIIGMSTLLLLSLILNVLIYRNYQLLKKTAIEVSQKALITPTVTSEKVLIPNEEKFQIDGNLLRYTNNRYGFSFTFPKNWSLTTESNGLILYDDRYKTELEISFLSFTNNKSSIARICPTGIAAGEMVEDGKISFMNNSLNIENLVYEKRIKERFYGGCPVEISRNNLKFFIVLKPKLEEENFSEQWDNFNLNYNVTMEADKIVNSFKSEGN